MNPATNPAEPEHREIPTSRNPHLSRGARHGPGSAGFAKPIFLTRARVSLYSGAIRYNYSGEQ
jgi:hypothetical protein